MIDNLTTADLATATMPKIQIAKQHVVGSRGQQGGGSLGIGRTIHAQTESGQAFFQKHADTFLVIDDQDGAALNIFVIIFRERKRLGRDLR